MSGNGTMMTPDRWLDWPSGYHFLPSVEEQRQREARITLATPITELGLRTGACVD